MPVIPFAEWLPDQPSGTGSSQIQNVMPLTDKSYGPFPTPLPWSAPMPERVQGSYAVFDPQRKNFTFGAGASNIYLLQPGSVGSSWLNVSKAPNVYTTLPFDQGGMWASCGFGDLVVFTNGLDPVQSYLLNTSTTFEDLSPDAPLASYCAPIRDFLFLGNTYDPVDFYQVRRVWWSSIADPHDWPTPGSDLAVQRQSDFQDLVQTELGHVRGIVGGNLSGADGAVIMERGVYRIVYTGSPAIFEFHVAEGSSGTTSPWSIVTRRALGQSGYRSVAYYLGDGGFVAFDGTVSTPIGAGKWDRYILADMEPARRFQTLGVATPQYELIIWAYIGRGWSSAALYNKLLVYNWMLGRAAICDISPAPIDWVGASLMSNLSLDDLDPFGDVDSLPLSFDSPLWQIDVPTSGVFDAQHRLAYMNGPALAATVETSENAGGGRRTKIHGRARPVIDGAGSDLATMSVGHRERLSHGIVYDAEVPVDVLGNFPLRSTGNHVRMRLRLPAAANFTHLRGIEVEPRGEGRLR